MHEVNIHRDENRINEFFVKRRLKLNQFMIIEGNAPDFQ